MNTNTKSSGSVDETKIKAIFREMFDGWEKGSGELFAAPFTENADFIAFDGSHTKGREEIAAAHQELFDKYLKGSRLVGEITEIRFLSADVALIQATGGTILKDKVKPSPERTSIQTLVAVRKESVWKFTAFHNNRIRPIGKNPTNAFIWLITDWLWKSVAKNEI